MYFSSIDPSSFRPRSLICTLRRPRASGGVCSNECTASIVQDFELIAACRWPELDLHAGRGMVILVVDRNRVRALEPKSQSPVSAHLDRPEAFTLALQGMETPARRPHVSPSCAETRQSRIRAGELDADVIRRSGGK